LPNDFSTFRPVISGVPQGSVLKPVLFLIYINHIVDLLDNSDVCTKLYADDVKIYLEITNDSDSVTLQDGINKIYAWSNEWQLRLANDKCQHNHINLSTAAHLVDYSVSGVDLQTVENIRDLGVLVDLSFRDHINSIVSLLYDQIWRRFMCKDADNLIKAFTRYVRPMLEYCSPLWSPVSPNLINHVESVQRRFTKRLPGFRSLVYNERWALSVWSIVDFTPI